MKKKLIALLVMAMNVTVLCSVVSATGLDSEVGMVNGTVMISSDLSDVYENPANVELDGERPPVLESATKTFSVIPQRLNNPDTTTVANAILKKSGNLDIRLSAGGDNTYTTYMQVNSDEVLGNDTPKLKLWSEGSASAARGVTGLYIKASNGECANPAIYSFEADVYVPQARTLRYVISRCQRFDNTWDMYTEPGGYIIPDAITRWKKLRIDLDVDSRKVSTYLDNELLGQPSFYETQEQGYPAGYIGIMSINNGTIYIDNIKFTKIEKSIKLSLNKSNLAGVKSSVADSTLSITGTNKTTNPYDIYAIMGAYDDENNLLGIYQSKKTISADGSVVDGSIPLSNINYFGSNSISNVTTLKLLAWNSLDVMSPYIRSLEVKDNTNTPVVYDINTGDTEHEGYTGSGFSGIGGGAGQTDVITYNATEAGVYELRVRYANGDASTKTLSLYVNNADQEQISFESNNTGFRAWRTWSDVVTTVTLNPGANTIYLSKDAEDSGGLNLDAIRIKPVTP